MIDNTFTFRLNNAYIFVYNLDILLLDDNILSQNCYLPIFYVTDSGNVTLISVTVAYCKSL